MQQKIIEVLGRFKEDNRITTVHISLYMALRYLQQEKGSVNPFCIKRNELIAVSKISGKATYYKTITDLDSYGYIKYIPSKNIMAGSEIHIY